MDHQATIESAAKEVGADSGRLDILINNAGYLEPNVRIADGDPYKWWETWTVVRLVVGQICQPEFVADMLLEYTWTLPHDTFIPPLDARKRG